MEGEIGMDPSFDRVINEIRLHVAARVETVLRPEMDGDPVERAWRMAGYYLALKDLPDDEDAVALLRIAAPYLEPVRSIPSPDCFWELVEFAHGARKWDEWRRRARQQLRLSSDEGDEELALARYVCDVGQFDVWAMADLVVRRVVPYPGLDRILEGCDEDERARGRAGRALYLCTQRWARWKPPLLEKVASNVYRPLPELCDLFEREPLSPEPPSWLRESQKE
jgi:hypothetical protein